jgi:hypothetical protein
MKVTEVDLPGTDHVDTVADWELPTTDGDDVVRIYGRFLGLATTHRDRHTHDGEFASQGERCGACRWFEPRIFRELVLETSPGGSGRPTERWVGGRYLVHYAGQTDVPGEETRTRHEWVDGPHEVLEQFVTRNRPNRPEPFLTAPAARVLAQAAQYDDELEHAYLNRAVS